jgi:nucleoside-diphosphate-sugar epimerase
VRYFVTGATGFIGSELVRQLHATGVEVVALVREPAKATALETAGVELRAGDVTNSKSVRDAMRGADGVFHVAGWYRIGERQARAAWTTNVEGTRNVLEASHDLAIPRAVYTSTLGVFSDTRGRIVDERYRYAGPWLSVYEHTKWVAHFEVALPAQRSGLPLVIVQPGAVYGRGDGSQLGQALHAASLGRLPFVPGRSAYCWGHVEDTARAHVLAMERGALGASYIVAGPPHTLAEAFLLAAKATGAPPPRLVVPPWVLRALASVLSVAERTPVWPALPPELSAEYLRVSAGATYLGTSARAERELGFTARPLGVGLRQLFAQPRP